MSSHIKNLKKKKINIIPLIDIIFILLIFFMLATNFRTKENIDISITSSKSYINETNPKKVLEVQIKNNREVIIQNNIFLIENSENLGSKINDIFFNEKYDSVLVTCDDVVILQNLILVMDIIKDEKINNVFFSQAKNE